VAETTETKISTIEDAVGSMLAPIEDEIEETIKEEAQATEESTEPDVEITAESEEEETIELDEDSETEELVAESEGEEDQEVEDAVQEESPTFSVKVDGNNEKVTLEELKQGYSGQKYVQKGMQEAAAQRKQAEEVYSALLSERQQISQLYNQLQSGDFIAPPAPPSREDFTADPLGYMDSKLAYDEAKVEYDTQMQQLHSVSQQNTEAENQAKHAYLQREMEELTKIIPELGNPDKAKQFQEKLILGGKAHYGYTAQEIEQVMDHRAIQVLHDAMKYQDIIAGKAKAVAKTKKAKPALKAGAKKVPEGSAKVRERQKAKLRKSGSINDAIDLMLNTQ